MTLKPSYLSFSAAKRLALFSPLLCLLLLTACAPQQSGLQHHQYSIVRYHDSLTALHDYRPPARETLSHTARRELQTAGAAVSQNGSNVRFTPIPDEEFDDGDIEVTPELLKEPSLYPALSLIQPIKETIRVTSSFGPRKHPVKRRRLMHAGVDIAGNRGEKVVASAPAPELTEYFPVKVWKTPYMGTEKSIEEIEAKREIEYRTLFQVKKHSGEFMMWSNAESSFVQCAPSDGYIFDVLVKNSGGYKTFTDMQLIPVRESDYEPSIYDPETGLVQGQDYVTPNSLTLFQTESGDYMFPEDVHIYFRENQDNDDDVKSLTFRFYGPDYTPISPSSFNQTDWANLIHGFNMEKTDEYVKYDVVYPMPLVEMKSKYTNKDGNRINVNFLYDRITASGYRMTSTMSFEFAIYKEAHWEIIVVFTAGAPLFEDGK